MYRIVYPLLLLAFFQMEAQYFETGVKLGTTNYVGDLTGQSLSQHGYAGAFGLFARYNASRRWSVTGSLLRSQLRADDANNPDPSLRSRNLSFRTNLVELEMRGEYNLMNFNIRADQTSTPFLFTGISAFHFNPQASLNGQFVDLRPLGTEGQFLENGNGFNYKNWQVAVPMGLGFKFGIGYKTTLGVEFGYRLTFTDYLDDAGGLYADVYKLSAQNPQAAQLAYRADNPTADNPVGTPRADASNNDQYFFFGATLAVNLTDRYGLDLDPEYRHWQNREEKAAARKAERELEKLKRIADKKARQDKRAERKPARAERRMKREKMKNARKLKRTAEREHRDMLRATAKAKQAKEPTADNRQPEQIEHSERAAWKQARADAKAAHVQRKAAEKERRVDIKAQKLEIKEKAKAARRLARERVRQLKRHKVATDNGVLEKPVKKD